MYIDDDWKLTMLENWLWIHKIVSKTRPAKNDYSLQCTLLVVQIVE